jgi:hypothetical protein
MVFISQSDFVGANGLDALGHDLVGTLAKSGGGSMEGEYPNAHVWPCSVIVGTVNEVASDMRGCDAQWT